MERSREAGALGRSRGAMVLNEAPGADPSEGLMSLSLEFRSIDHAPPKQKPMPELPKAVRAEAYRTHKLHLEDMKLERLHYYSNRM